MAAASFLVTRVPFLTISPGGQLVDAIDVAVSKGSGIDISALVLLGWAMDCPAWIVQHSAFSIQQRGCRTVGWAGGS